ncbi:MAG: hypothetical protein GX755_08940 [Syntrophomonadaceae bacterium]|nr:hypothetical protein [Syntrophomonadaceae bacterium]
MSIFQRIILVAGLLLVIFFTIIQPPTKPVIVDNPERIRDYTRVYAYPEKIIQDIPDIEAIIRYDLVVILGTAVLFFVVKPGSKS